MIMETAVALMAKPFIEGVVKEVVIPKVKAFCENVSDGVKMDFIPKTDQLRV